MSTGLIQFQRPLKMKQEEKARSILIKDDTNSIFSNAARRIILIEKTKKRILPSCKHKADIDITDAFVKVFQDFCFENLRHGIHA